MITFDQLIPELLPLLSEDPPPDRASSAAESLGLSKLKLKPELSPELSTHDLRSW